MEKIAKSAATQGISGSYRPSLILIQNMAAKRELVKDSNRLTEDFFKTHDKEKSLLQSYYEVHCVQIPDTDFGEDLFNEYLTKLQVTQIKLNF